MKPTPDPAAIHRSQTGGGRAGGVGDKVTDSRRPFDDDRPMMIVPDQRSSHLLEEFLNKNVGGIDRILRILVGLALIGSAVAGVLGPWAYIGAVPLATGVVGWCPAYLPFGLKTCKINQART